ncbi:MAG: nitronate monooxygenase [Ilumatobacter sp.]|nr:nitronate monooxygenase [Ilumatobacter sp.]
MFGLDHPVMSAPMALHSGGTLAGAVSAAGALGAFGGIHPTKGPEWIHAEFARMRAITDRPSGVGFITSFIEPMRHLFDSALAEQPTVVALSFGDPRPWLGQAKASGAAVVCQVQNLTDADVAVEAGTDVLVAQGNSAGGHTGTMGMLPLLTALVDRHPGVPVLAAGGIGNGRALAAALAAGADGAWVGTALLATPEAVEVHDLHKELIVESDGTDTVFTTAYDIVSGLPWPEGIGERVRRNRFTDQWEGREVELQMRRDEFTRSPETNPFEQPPDPETDSVLYGESAGAVTAIRPAAEVVRTMCDEAEALLRERPPALLGD